MPIPAPLRGALAALAALALAASPTPGRAGDKDLVFGVCPGPYGDMVKKALKPGLEQRGWRVTVREFSDYVQPNLALASGAIQANLFQHRVYLDKFSKDKGLSLAPLLTVPTLGVGLYSRRVKSLAELKAGDEVTLANDPTNLARALALLEKNGLVKLRPEIDPTRASEKDVVENPRGLKLRPIEAAQLPRSLDSVALSAVNGNFAVAAGLDPASALAMEKLEERHKNLVAVRAADVDKPFVKDLEAVLRSPEFRAAVDGPGSQFRVFEKPDWMLAAK
jgi:D-methionine transport system substrate-binding protein